jgi:hypothetical protein
MVANVYVMFSYVSKTQPSCRSHPSDVHLKNSTEPILHQTREFRVCGLALRFGFSKK